MEYIKRVLEDEHRYDAWYEELHRVALFIVENKTAITHIYDSKSRDVLENYLFAITGKITNSFVEREAKRLLVSDEDNMTFIIVEIILNIIPNVFCLVHTNPDNVRNIDICNKYLL